MFPTRPLMSARNETDAVVYGAPLQHPYLYLGSVLAGSKFGLSSGKDLGAQLGCTEHHAGLYMTGSESDNWLGPELASRSRI